MSYLGKIELLNKFDQNKVIPIMLGNNLIGLTKKSHAVILKHFSEVFQIGENSIIINPSLDTFEKLTQAHSGVVSALIEKGIIRISRERLTETFPVVIQFDSPELFRVARGAIKFFGYTSYGVHLNLTVTKPDGSRYMWIPRRSANRPSYQNKLDNSAGGGLNKMHPEQVMIRESRDELGLNMSDFIDFCLSGVVSYTREVEGGIERVYLLVYEGEVSESFIPVSQDGESSEFLLMPIEEVLTITRDTIEFKDNCNLVNIHYGIIHGYINTHNEANYIQICQDLNRFQWKEKMKP